MATGAMAQDVTIRLAHLNPEDPFASHSGAMGAVFKSLVESNSNGRIEVQLFPNGQLGKDNEVIEQVRSGLVESTISSSGGMAQHYPLVGVFDIPFAFPNIGVASKVIDTDSSFGEAFVADLEEKTGLEVLGLLDSGGFFAFTDSVRPIASVEDMDGLKIRTMQNPIHVEAFRAYGANPTPMSYSELYGALQSGVVDGAEGASTGYDGMKFYEVAPSFALVGWLNMTAPVTMKKDAFDALPEDIQTALMEAGAEAASWQRQYVVDQEQPLLDSFAEMGVTITEPDTTPFIEASQPLYESQLTTDGQKALFDALTSE